MMVMMNTYTGNLVSLEGIDGSGTTTLQNALRGCDYDAVYTHEPSSGKYGRIIREELQKDSDPTASDFFLFCADRYDHCYSFIGPALDAGEDVITDRYQLSTYAYQSRVLSETMDVSWPIEYIDNVVSQFVIEPDLTILIDIPVDVALDRVSDSEGSIEKYEKRERLEEAREVYLQQAGKRDYVEVIDGTQSESEVLDDALELIGQL